MEVDVYTFEKNSVVKKNISIESILKNAEILAQDFKNDIQMFEDDDSYIIISEKRATVFKKGTPEYNVIKLILNMLDDIPYPNEIIQESKMIFDECIKILEKKNHDYGGGIGDPYFTFRLSEHLKLCSVEEAILIRLCDKISRIRTLLEKQAKCKDEPLEDTIKDAINYLVLMLIYIRRKGDKDGSSL